MTSAHEQLPAFDQEGADLPTALPSLRVVRINRSGQAAKRLADGRLHL